MRKSERKRKAYRYGLASERWARVYLTCKGYRLLAGRMQNAGGEIDIVAQKGKTLVAIEVKARKDFSQCEETVPPCKQQKIARAMEGFVAGRTLHAHAQTPNIRFDVIWVVPWRLPRHIKDAWRV